MVATRTAPERVHYAALDGCRAYAALGVVLVHVALLSGYADRTRDGVGAYLSRLDVGVSVFFVLSGFLLYRPFVAARFGGRPARDLATYARRRLLRIFPAYWVALVLVGYVLEAPAFEDPHTFWQHALLIHVYDADQLVGGPIQQSWTLATELSFYAFLPAYAWVLARVDRPPSRQLRAEVTGLIALWGGSTALKALTIAAGASPSTFGELSPWLPYRLDEFALGMSIAVASAWWAHDRGSVPAVLTTARTTLVSWAIAVGLFVALVELVELPTFPLFTAGENFLVRVVYSFVGFFFVAPAVLAGGSAPVRRVLANRAIVWLGLVSYGIYIWHEAAQELYLRWFDRVIFDSSVLEMGLVTLAITVPVAAASFYLVERPAMRYKRAAPLPTEAPPATASVSADDRPVSRS